MLVVDQSGSTRVGDPVSKAGLAVEVAAVLALAAAYQNDRVGALLFADQVEHVVPPRKGRRHALRVIRDLVAFEPGEPGHGPRRGAHLRRPPAAPSRASWSSSPTSSRATGSGRCAASPRGTTSWRSRWTTRASSTLPDAGWAAGCRTRRAGARWFGGHGLGARARGRWRGTRPRAGRRERARVLAVGRRGSPRADGGAGLRAGPASGLRRAGAPAASRR